MSLQLIAFTVRNFILHPVIDYIFNSSRPVDVLRHVFKHAKEGNPSSVLETIDDFGRNRRHLVNVGPEKGEIIDEIFKRVRPSTVVELGAFVGYSAVRFSSLLSEGSRYVSFEADPLCAAVATKICEHAGVNDRVRVVVGKASEKIHILPRLGIRKADLVFLDHWKEDYLPDLKLLEEVGVVGPGTVVVADNTIMPGAPGYLEYVRGCGRYESKEYVSRYPHGSGLVDAVEESLFKIKKASRQ